MKPQMRETILYIVFGILTTAINFIAFYLFHIQFQMELILSNTIAWIFAVAFAFFTNRNIVFQSKGDKGKQAFSFFTSRLISLLIENVLLIIFHFLQIPAMISKFLVSFGVLTSNYVAAKLFIFKEHKEDMTL